MLGLIEKDLRLLWKQKSTLAIYTLVTISLGLTTEDGFVVGYASILGIILALSTVSYDELENGYAFLFSLPVERGMYVAEKYLLCIGVAVIGWAFGFVVYEIRNGWTEVMENVLILPVELLILPLFLPIQLKYGVERMRYIYLLVFGGSLAVGFLLVKLLPHLKAGADLAAALDQASPAIVIPAAFLACAAVMTVSWLWSVGIMKRKAL